MRFRYNEYKMEDNTISLKEIEETSTKNLLDILEEYSGKIYYFEDQGTDYHTEWLDSLRKAVPEIKQEILKRIETLKLRIDELELHIEKRNMKGMFR